MGTEYRQLQQRRWAKSWQHNATGLMQSSKSFAGEIIASEGSGRGRKWRVRWDGDVKIGESVHSCKVLENAGSVEEIEDDV